MRGMHRRQPAINSISYPKMDDEHNERDDVPLKGGDASKYGVCLPIVCVKSNVIYSPIFPPGIVCVAVCRLVDCKLYAHQLRIIFN